MSDTWIDRMAVPLVMYLLILGIAILLHLATNGYLDAWHTIVGCALWVSLKTSWEQVRQ